MNEPTDDTPTNDTPTQGGPAIERNAVQRITAMLQHDASGWQLLGLLPEPGDHEGPPRRRLVRDADDMKIYQWHGLPLRLLPDQTDDYYFNLTSPRPTLYLICQPDADGAPQPLRVSADQDDAVAAVEMDELLLQAPMPGSIVEWLKLYVETHWTPGPRKNRRKPNERKP
ncbi:MAG: DUF3305 domain-containing protein [Wenzhouxiangellaceae bacterium]|nr:DUF3305 domain-containing protein [Wenzhouxiangellaceae bacterium]